MVSWKKQKDIEKQDIIENHCFDYDQNPGESNLNYKLFTIYRELGRTRNFVKVTNLHLSKKYPEICRIATENQWKGRADQWDRDHEKEMQIKLDEEILYSRLRQANMGKDLQNIAKKGMEMLSEEIEEMSPNEIIKFAEIGAKLESLALGKSTEITESKVKVDKKVEVKVELIDPEIAEEVGKLIAIKASKEVEV